MLILTINELGDSSVRYICVDFNIRLGKKSLISDKAYGKWLGDFASLYNVDYDQVHLER